MLSGAAPRLPPAPEDFDAFVAWLGTLGDRLVLLEEYDLPQVRGAFALTEHRIRVHLDSGAPNGEVGPFDSRAVELATLVRSDHRWFEASLEELAVLRGVVEREDHGGHRQALGQYARLVAAALARHRVDEAELERLRGPAGLAP